MPAGGGMQEDVMLSWLPENVSTFGADIDSVYALIFWCVAPWFLLTEGLILLSMLWFRRRPGRRAQYLRGDTWGQLAWILVPTAIVLGLDFWIDLRSAPVWANVKQHVPAANAYQVKVLAKQFNWQFTYPGPDGAFGTADDKQLDNELHVPIDRDVVFTLESSDVVHSFFVPVLRLKQDVLPGRTIRGWFNATQAGRFELPCAELCGFGHYTMRGFLVVHTPEAFDQWTQETWPTAPGAGS